MAQDVFKILKDLELKAVGLDPSTNKMQEGYFAAFRPIGLPISSEDYFDPWTPSGINPPKPRQDPRDPKGLPSNLENGKLDEDIISAADVTQAMKSYLNTFYLIDSKLQMNNDYSVIPGSSKVSDTWNAIVTGANGIPQNQEIKPELKQAYDAAQAMLNSPKYDDYQKYQKAYNAAVTAYHKAYADYFTNPQKFLRWPVDGVLYDNAVKQASKDWINRGSKIDIEKANNTLAAQGTDPSMILINDAKDRFSGSLNSFMNIGQIPYTFLTPNSWYDKDIDDGWTEYTNYDFHNESHYSASQTAYGGGGGFSLGFWSVGGGFNSDIQRSSLNITTNNLSVTFSYCMVDIVRPWLDTTLLNLKGWFIMGDYKKNCISDGTMGQLVTGKVEPLFLPSIVTSLILIKNLTIKWDNCVQDWHNAQSSIDSSASVGWGPFAVNGHYSHHEQSRDFVCDAEGEALVIPGIQLVGYISAINPPSPAVDSSDYVNVHPTQQ
jgi:hypothetical protein